MTTHETVNGNRYIIHRLKDIKTYKLQTCFWFLLICSFPDFASSATAPRNLIGTENKGFQIIMSNFNHERWMITVVCIARARICTEEFGIWDVSTERFDGIP